MPGEIHGRQVYSKALNSLYTPYASIELNAKTLAPTPISQYEEDSFGATTNELVFVLIGAGLTVGFLFSPTVANTEIFSSDDNLRT